MKTSANLFYIKLLNNSKANCSLFKWAPEVLTLLESEVGISIRYKEKDDGLGARRYSPVHTLPLAISVN